MLYFSTVINMNDFFENDLDITEITLATYVKSGTGSRHHRNRSSHGIAFNVLGNKKYVFDKYKTIDIDSRQIIFLPKGSNYEVKNPDSGDCYAINFNLRDNTDFESFSVSEGSNITYEALFKQAADVWLKKGNGYMLKCKSILYEILYLMKKSCADLNRNKNQDMLHPAMEYINANYYKKKISINKLANLCNVSDTYFRRIFFEVCGTTPVKHINKLKIMRAQELLLSGLYSVSEVCRLSGFANDCYFSRIFRESTGVPPAEFGK